MKSFLSKPGLSTVLLSAVVVLLLILVIRNAQQSFTPAGPVIETPAPSGMSSGGFDHTQMLYTSLTCPDDPTLTLDAPSCTGKKTEVRRAMVTREIEKKKPIREIFDDIVKEYGENALTPEARSIRARRPESKP
ncbi:MAG: hypothetical protein V1798_02555 [Pseudomonadota bacterium]